MIAYCHRRSWSTLVLPQVYLKECFRVLKPGGRLILSLTASSKIMPARTTIGDGQHMDSENWWKKAGFEVERVTKLTTGPRGAVFLVERERRPATV